MTTNKDTNVAKNNQAALDPTIEELATKHLFPSWVMAGVKRFYGWGSGKRMSEKEFLQKVETWKKGPMTRKEDNK